MGARHKLNSAALNGALIVAGLVAFVTQSWVAFCIAAVALLATAVHSGDIRWTRRR